MQQKTKIQLSKFEQDLVMNADWILTKNAIMEKMKVLLQECLDLQIKLLNKQETLLPPEVFNTSPKIAKGENYKGLPWLLLDYPRHFNKENVFAIRTLFWWGRYFSITLHLSGHYKKLFAKKVNRAFESLRAQRFYCCVNANEWEHHFEEDNYKLLGQCNEEEFHQIIDEKKFIKLSIRIDLHEWQQLPLRTFEINKFLLEILD
jgi:hypothetical protein